MKKEIIEHKIDFILTYSIEIDAVQEYFIKSQYFTNLHFLNILKFFILYLLCLYKTSYKTRQNIL